jgi:FAD/FMN-containing dehydrogenase/Fe-S oxidoreductase
MPQPEAQHVLDKPQSMGGAVEWTNPDRTRAPFEGDASALEAELTARVDGEVRFDSGSKATYATDASNYRQVPVGVVLPRSTGAMVETIKVCHAHGAPATHRGCGTSLAGQCCNETVIIDSSKYCDGVVEINAEQQYARVEPGVRRDQLTDRTEREHNLTFAPDTSTHEYATFGGMIGNNSCGMHSQMARRTQDNVEEMEVLLYDGTRMRVGPTSEDELDQIIAEGGRKGEIYENLCALRDEYADLIRERYPDIPRRVSGYNLEELLPENGFNVARALVGAEGTCVNILEATVTLVHSPPERVLLVLGFEDVYAAGDHVVEVGELGPVALEGLDQVLIAQTKDKGLFPDAIASLPDGGGWLIAEFGGATKEEAKANAKKARAEVEDFGWDALVDAKVVSDAGDQANIWQAREAGLGVTAHRADGRDAWPGWEDSAIPPSELGDYMRDLRDLYDKYGYDAALYGHFGQACVHTRIPFDLRTDEGLSDYRDFVDEASDLCMEYGGSFSAEHGDGQARGELLPKMYGKEGVEAFRKFRAIWDPDGKMNPGKVVDPYAMTDNLRLGTDYDPPSLDTDYGYPEDDGDFSQAALRCVGVGKCRTLEPESVMCPSFVATREEEHSTRGRSRLLFEMLNGDETPDAWNNDDVKEALDLCLACKGCKSDCPVNVDMATYKSEFLSRYYDYPENLRPRSAYAFGLIYWWARLASLMPGVANFFSQTSGLDAVAKKIAGVASEREMPAFAEETFRDWFQRVKGQRSQVEDQTVVLFPDTFNNYFKPRTLKATTHVLEDAGFCVEVPEQTLCCGRPLYDYGWNDTAKRLWHEMLGGLRSFYREGVPVVGAEPSCVAAFRDELPNLLPNDEDAKRLSENMFTLGEFLAEHADDDYEPPSLNRKALVHGHCHHLSIMGIDGEKELLDAMDVEYDMPATSCCGMAGPFGFEEEHYDVSIRAGEHKLLPAVRGADPETLIITDGFSCREQIEQTTGRRALHLAEAMHLAMRRNGRAERYPETHLDEAYKSANGSVARTALAAAGGFALSAAAAYVLTD